MNGVEQKNKRVKEGAKATDLASHFPAEEGEGLVHAFDQV